MTLFSLETFANWSEGTPALTSINLHTRFILIYNVVGIFMLLFYPSSSFWSKLDLQETSSNLMETLLHALIRFEDSSVRKMTKIMAKVDFFIHLFLNLVEVFFSIQSYTEKRNHQQRAKFRSGFESWCLQKDLTDLHLTTQSV